MDINAAIPLRRSRRAYLDTAIPSEARAALHALIDDGNRKHGLSVSLLDDGSAAFAGLRRSYGMFSGVRSLFLLKGSASDSDLNEKLGHFGELLVLEATCLGLGTCWVGGTFDRNNPVFALTPDIQMPCVITVGLTPDGDTGRERLIRRLTHRKTRPLETLYTADVEPSEWFLDGMRAVQLAPSAMNAQPARFTLRDGRVTASVPNTPPNGSVDLGIAKLHFELGAGGTFALGNGGEFTKGE